MKRERNKKRERVERERKEKQGQEIEGWRKGQAHDKPKTVWEICFSNTDEPVCQTFVDTVSRKDELSSCGIVGTLTSPY